MKKVLSYILTALLAIGGYHFFQVNGWNIAIPILSPGAHIEQKYTTSQDQPTTQPAQVEPEKPKEPSPVEPEEAGKTEEKSDSYDKSETAKAQTNSRPESDSDSGKLKGDTIAQVKSKQSGSRKAHSRRSRRSPSYPNNSDCYSSNYDDVASYTPVEEPRIVRNPPVGSYVVRNGQLYEVTRYVGNTRYIRRVYSGYK